MNLLICHNSGWTCPRLVFFADPIETGRPEEGAGEGGGGVSEEAAEAAAEERRQSAAAAKRQRQEERKVKKRDHRLASILEFFIHGVGQDDKMAILLSRLLARNTPVSLLLAVLSLNYPEVNEVLESYLEEEQEVLPDEVPEVQTSDHLQLVSYGKELSDALAAWTRRIFVHASFRPMKTILPLAHLHGVDHNMIQLTSLMIQQFFKELNQEIEMAKIQEFAELFWRDTLKKLHHLASDRGLLADPTGDPYQDLEDHQQEHKGEDNEEEEEAVYTKFQRRR